MSQIRLLEDLSRIPPTDPRLLYVKQCTRCKLSPHLGLNPECSQVVSGQGNLQAEVLCVLMFPGPTEDKYGFTAVGPANELMGWFEQFGFSRYINFYWHNSVMCFIPTNREKNRAKQDELDACKYNLSQVIDLMPNLKLIIMFGWDAIKAVEGRNSTVSARLFNIGKVQWIPASHEFKKGRSFLTYALWHPAYIQRKRGKVRELLERKYRAGLAFISDVIKRGIGNVENFKLPENNLLLFDRNKAFGWQKWHLEDNRITRYAKDFETLGKRGYYNPPIGVAYAYENPDTGIIESAWIPLKQCLDLPKAEHYKVRMVKHKGHFLMKWKWEGWFDDPDFEQKFMQGMKKIEDIGAERNGRIKPSFTSWQSSFEYLATKGEYGYDFCGSDEQMGLEAYKKENLRWDGLPAFRSIMNTNSMKLASILEICMPLIAQEKEPAQKLLSEHELDATGFGLLARKPPITLGRFQDDLEELRESGLCYNEWLASLKHGVGRKVKKEQKKDCPLAPDRLEIIERVWSPEYEDFYFMILARRACFDAARELELDNFYVELSENEEEFGFAGVANKHFDEDFFGDNFVNYVGELSANEISPEF